MGHLVTNETAAALREILLGYGNVVSRREVRFSETVEALTEAAAAIEDLFSPNPKLETEKS